jgi:hypothetical protein
MTCVIMKYERCQELRLFVSLSLADAPLEVSRKR